MTKKTAPTKTVTELMEPLDLFALDRVFVPCTKDEFAAATAEIMASGTVGFDTESKPTFKKGEVSDGPHVVQFATQDKAFLFQLCREDCRQFLIDVLSSEEVLKVGFGLKNDYGHIHRKLGVKMRASLDLNSVFRRDGYGGTTGVRAAVAIVFSRRFHKSKSVTKSDWSSVTLSPRQKLYAANDAYAALLVMNEFDRSMEELPISGKRLRHGKPSASATLSDRTDNLSHVQETQVPRDRPLPMLLTVRLTAGSVPPGPDSGTPKRGDSQ